MAIHTLFQPWRLLRGHTGLLLSLIRQGIRTRQAGSVLGLLWLLGYPLLFLSMYSLVFVHVLNVRVPGLASGDYVLVIFSGLVPFLAFSEGLSVGVQGVVANSGLIRNTLVPIELLPLRDAVVGHVNMGIGMLLVWLTALYNGHLSWSQLAIPLLYLIQIVMVTGLVWLLATLNVFFRDIGQLTPLIVLFLMLISPIAYTADMVPPNMASLLSLNPLAGLMALYRACLMGGDVPWLELLRMALFAVVIFQLGYWVLSRLKPLFSDYV